MPKKNTTGGSAHRGRKRTTPKMRKVEEYAKNVNPEDGKEFYGIVLAEKGNKRFEVRLQNGDVRICPLSKSIRRYIKSNTYVLVKEPSYNNTDGYIVEVYNDEELSELKRCRLWDMVEKDPDTVGFAMSSSEESSSEDEDETPNQPTMTDDAI